MKSFIVVMVLYYVYQGHEVKGSDCRENWIRYGDTDRCYYISDDYASFDVAQKHCESKNSQLASVLTNDDELILSSILAPERDKCDGYGDCLEFWIGVRDFYGENKWETIGSIAVDKENQFWAKGYPKYNGRCVLMSFEDNRTKGLWKNEYCERLLKFVCIKCPDGFKYVPEIDQCLYLNLDGKSWDDARVACASKAKGAQLLMIKDWAKQQAVRNYLEDQFKGTESEMCSNPNWLLVGKHAWIGGQTADPNQCKSPYIWKPLGAAGTPFNYTNWYPRMPNCIYEKENCAIIATFPQHSYQWEDNVCYEKVCYVCEL